MIFDGDVLYSYGHHFPLVVRLPWGYLMNADNRSVTTSQHQSHCASWVQLQVPFSALGHVIDVSSYGIVDRFSHSVRPIEICPEVWEHRGWIRWSEEHKREYLTNKEYDALPKSEKELCHEDRERRPSQAVLEIDGKYYLSGMDMCGATKRRGGVYFLAELPCPCQSVSEALWHLESEQVHKAREQGVVVIRQGEWFFVALALNGAEVKRAYKIMQANMALPRGPGSNEHIVTRLGHLADVAFDAEHNGFPSYGKAGDLVVSGAVRHREHGRLVLSTLQDPKLYLAYPGRAIRSFSASGRVD